MSLIKIEFQAMDDDSGEAKQLCVVEWPFVPRVGERVVLDSLMTYAEWCRTDIPDDQKKTELETQFVVDDVCYRGSAEKSEREEYAVEIFLVLPPEERGWAGFARPDDSEP